MAAPEASSSTSNAIAERLGEFVRRVDAAVGDHRHIAMYSIDIQLDLGSLHDIDPFSDAYTRAVLDLFRVLHPGPYLLEGESDVLDFDVEAPTPFGSRSPAAVGSHFAAIATILRDFPVNPPGRVLDAGAGWGHTSIMLARTGFDVDALDVNERYLALIDLWAERLHIADRLKTLRVDYDRLASLRAHYTAILFFESFHHSLNHGALLDSCLGLLDEGGAIVFAGEPIYATWPVPWSVRSDSLAAYCIHRYGWMELGFNEEYFLELLMRRGLWAERRVYAEYPAANSYVARRTAGIVLMTSLALAPRYADTWHPAEPGHRWSTGASVLPGSLLGGRSVALHVGNYRDRPTTVELRAGGTSLLRTELAPMETRSLEFNLPGPADEVLLLSDTWRPDTTDGRTLGVAVTAIAFGAPERG